MGGGLDKLCCIVYPLYMAIRKSKEQLLQQVYWPLAEKEIYEEIKSIGARDEISISKIMRHGAQLWLKEYRQSPANKSAK